MKAPNKVQQNKSEVARRLRVDRTVRGPVEIILPDQRPVTRSFLTPEELAVRRGKLPSEATVETGRKRDVGSTIVANMNRANREGRINGGH